MNLAHWIRVLGNHPRPLRLVAARVLQRTGLSRLFTIQLDGYALRFYPTNVSANLWINADSRFHDLSLFKDYCRPGDTVVDVGANIGEVSIVVSQRVGAAGQRVRVRAAAARISVPARQPGVESLQQRQAAERRAWQRPRRRADVGRQAGRHEPHHAIRRDRGDVFDARRRVAVGVDRATEDRCRGQRAERPEGRQPTCWPARRA